MIARLKGNVWEVGSTYIVIDVNGVGYFVQTPLNVVSTIKGENVTIELYICTEVKEDSIELYGFLRKEERELFKLLRGVQGIGPQTALAILSTMSVEEFYTAIKERNSLKFSKIPKIGKKLAERIILEFEGKKLPLIMEGITTLGEIRGDKTIMDEAMKALESLGYKPNEILKVMDAVKKESDSFTLEEFIKRALQKLSL